MSDSKPARIATVIIRDDNPMIHCGDTPSYRTVRFALTDEQSASIALRDMEEISRVILEQEAGR